MPSALQTRRTAALNALADVAILEDEQREVARQAIVDNEAAQAAKKQRQLEAARKAEAAYLEGCQEYEAGLRQAMGGIRRMLDCTQPLLLIPGGSIVAGRDSIITRASRFLSAQLFSAVRNSAHFGTVRHFFSGKPVPQASFVDSERDMVSRIFPDHPSKLIGGSENAE